MFTLCILTCYIEKIEASPYKIPIQLQLCSNQVTQMADSPEEGFKFRIALLSALPSSQVEAACKAINAHESKSLLMRLLTDRRFLNVTMHLHKYSGFTKSKSMPHTMYQQWSEVTGGVSSSL